MGFFSSEVQGMLLKDIYSVTNDDHLMRFLVRKYGEVLCQKKKPNKQTKKNTKQTKQKTKQKQTKPLIYKRLIKSLEYPIHFVKKKKYELMW